MANEDLSREIEKLLMTEMTALEKEVKTVTKKYARKLRDKIIEDSPVDTTDKSGKVEHGVYKNGWRVSTSEGVNYIDCTVRQYRRPSLTWLLEKGHLRLDGGRTQPQPHIEANADEIAEEWEKEMRRLGTGM